MASEFKRHNWRINYTALGQDAKTEILAKIKIPNNLRRWGAHENSG